MSRATNDPRRTGRPAAVVDAVAPQPQLDYYLILSPATGVPSTADVEGIVVEEFVRGDDCATVGLNSAGWTAGEDGWWSSASFSRRMRAEPELAGRVTPTSRYVAETVYRQRGAGQLPAEPVLRTYFRDHQPFATAPPLRLGPTDPPDGFHEKRGLPGPVRQGPLRGPPGGPHWVCPYSGGRALT